MLAPNFDSNIPKAWQLHISHPHSESVKKFAIKGNAAS